MMRVRHGFASVMTTHNRESAMEPCPTMECQTGSICVLQSVCTNVLYNRAAHSSHQIRMHVVSWCSSCFDMARTLVPSALRCWKSQGVVVQVLHRWQPGRSTTPLGT
jgi:hypothetical protein